MDHPDVSSMASAVVGKQMNIPIKKTFSGFFFALGSLLLLVLLLGEVTNLGCYGGVNAEGEVFDQELADKARDMVALRAEAIARQGDWLNATSEDRMNALYSVVIQRFTYGSKAQYNIFSNWIMWGLGLFNRNAAFISNPDHLLKYGYTVMCHQASWVLAAMAREEKIPFRHVNLSGHVVMEAGWDNQWHLYDPAFEVVPKYDGKIVDVSFLEDRPDLVKVFYGKRGDVVARLFATKFNNSFVTNGMFIWKAQVLSLVEDISNYAKWFIPVLIICLGFFFYFKTERCKE